MTAPAESAPDFSTISFEEALSQLQDVVTALETGSLSLDETISQHRHGAALAAHCQRLLTEAELRISEVSPTEPAAGDAVADEPALP
jgi:exodeoxyribonuclease VII small subunit